MNDLKTLFRLLREEGVKSLHIEFQSALALPVVTTLETVERKDEPLPALTHATPAKHDIPVHRGEPAAPEMVAPVKPEPVVEKKAEPVPEKKPEPVIEKKPVEKKAEQKASPAGKPDDPIWVQLVAIANGDRNKEIELRQACFAKTGMKGYPVFCSINEKDDGTITNAHRTAMIDVLSKDELLLLNNEFGTGVDTDVPDNGREAIIAFFQ